MLRRETDFLRKGARKVLLKENRTTVDFTERNLYEKDWGVHLI